MSKTRIHIQYKRDIWNVINRILCVCVNYKEKTEKKSNKCHNENKNSFKNVINKRQEKKQGTTRRNKQKKKKTKMSIHINIDM